MQRWRLHFAGQHNGCISSSSLPLQRQTRQLAEGGKTQPHGVSTGRELCGVRRAGGTCDEAAAVEVLEGVEGAAVEHGVDQALRVDRAVLEVQLPQRRGVPGRRLPRLRRRRRVRRRRQLPDDAACDVQSVVVVLCQVVCMACGL